MQVTMTVNGATVSQDIEPRTLSPQQGFLHPKTELDTLGFDQPESQCTAFQ